MASNPNALQLDDQLVNGKTYTFVYKLQNWITSPSDQALQDDLTANAPDFLTSVQVMHQERFFTGDYYTVQFTYEGDGSDVVSDLANQLVAVFKVGSNDNFTFVYAINATASAVTSQAVEALQSAGTVLAQASTQLGAAAGQIGAGTLGGITSGLGSWLPVVLLGLAVILLFQLGGVSGIKKAVA